MTISKEWLTNSNVAVIKNMANVVGQVNLIGVWNKIRGNAYKRPIDEIRRLHQQGNEDGAAILKLKLDGVTFSAWMPVGERRKGANIKHYTKYACLDLDNISPTDLKSVKEKVKSLPETILCFISPTGNGLKIVCMLDTTIEQHAETYKKLLAYYEEKLGFKLDQSTSDAARLCFMSHDPEAYFNEDAEVFGTAGMPATPERERYKTNRNARDEELENRFLHCIRIANDTQSYSDGGRNNYVFYLANTSCRHGIPQNVLEELIFKHLPISQTKEETLRTIASAYNNIGQFETSVKDFYESLVSKVPLVRTSDKVSKSKKAGNPRDNRTPKMEAIVESLKEIVEDGNVCTDTITEQSVLSERADKMITIESASVTPLPEAPDEMEHNETSSPVTQEIDERVVTPFPFENDRNPLNGLTYIATQRQMAERMIEMAKLILKTIGDPRTVDISSSQDSTKAA